MKRSEAVDQLVVWLESEVEFHDKPYDDIKSIAESAVSCFEKLNLLPQNGVGCNWRGTWDNEDG